MKRPYNFSAGPAAMPESVLAQAAAEMLDWRGTGVSVMEMSHRSPAFEQISSSTEQAIRRVLSVPDNFTILFMQGGAMAQNALVPMNLFGAQSDPSINIVVSGAWSEKSMQEAKKYGTVHIAADNRFPEQHLASANKKPYTYFPDVTDWQLHPNAAYLHICTNETIHGIEWVDLHRIPASNIPLVIDASSHIASRPIDFTSIGVLYAGAQKNLGPAGVTVVIVRNDLLDCALPTCPTAFQYKAIAQQQSLLNTPPTYAIYMMGLVFEWIEQQGGMPEIQARNIAKAQALYDYLDSSSFYSNAVDVHVRSRMNIPFTIADTDLEPFFLEQAALRGLLQLKGHKSVGGFRASLYNAMPLAGVYALIEFLQDFEKQYG